MRERGRMLGVRLGVGLPEMASSQAVWYAGVGWNGRPKAKARGMRAGG